MSKICNHVAAFNERFQKMFNEFIRFGYKVRLNKLHRRLVNEIEETLLYQ